MINHKRIAAAALALVSIAACSKWGARDEGKPGRSASPLESGLPARKFLQLEPTCPGDTHEIAKFSYNNMREGAFDGALVATYGANGSFSLGSREANGAVQPIAPAGYYFAPTALATATYRLACATSLSLVDRGEGPRGRVFSVDTAQPAPITCWVNARGGAGWVATTIATSAPGEPADAFWTLLAVPSGPPEAQRADEFELGYWRDAEFNAQNLTSEGRAPREHLYVRTLGVRPDRTLSVTQTLLPSGESADGPMVDAKMLLAEQLPQPDCAGHCGTLYNNVTAVDCTRGDPDPVRKGCNPGLVCQDDNTCAPEACSPKTAAELCVNGNFEQACGVRPDGCGGYVACPGSCPSGTACGAAGDPRYCQRRFVPQTITTLRGAYQDVYGQLCGQIYDADLDYYTSTDTACSPGQGCVNNLCSPVDRGAGPGVPTCSCEPGAPVRCGQPAPPAGP